MRDLHVLVVDDEPLARRALTQALSERPEVGRISESADGLDAVERLRPGDVDLVFLDVQMPEVDGFEVLRRAGTSAPPVVVFVTAHDRYAVGAFEVRALDYLLKPFNRTRFEQAFERALEELAARARESSTPHGGDTGGLSGLESQRVRRLRIKLGGRTTVVDLQRVHWLEAANTYVRVHTTDGTHLLRASLAGLETQLDPDLFLRVHRSAIVRLGSIRELRHVVRGDYELVLANGDRVRASRRRREALFERIDSDML